MGSVKTKWSCISCGTETAGFLGKCPGCGEFGTIKEEVFEKQKSESKFAKPKHGLFISPEADVEVLENIVASSLRRFSTGFSEFDRVLGGGIVPGSISLIGGSPGVGKSTLLLEAASKFDSQVSINSQSSLKQASQKQSGEQKVLYVSAEESSQQIKLRADRLKLNNQNIYIYSENNLEKILAQIKKLEPDLVIVDSIQAIYLPQIDSIPGSINQIRETTSNLTRFAKATDIPVIIVGHINKDGDIAGPKILEHIVDTVLQFEGEKEQNFRILRAVKNRFGDTSEVGLFEMNKEGLRDLKNPSELFLKERSGGVITATKEGNRSLLLEIQALIVPSEYNNPRRLANGIGLSRLHQILAVLEKKLSINLSKADVYLNVIGGIPIRETSADLAIALAIYKSAIEGSENSEEDFIALGEIGLHGEIRAVSNIEARLKEAAKLGFKKAIIPESNFKELKSRKLNIELNPLKQISDIRESHVKVSQR